MSRLWVQILDVEEDPPRRVFASEDAEVIQATIDAFNRCLAPAVEVPPPAVVRRLHSVAQDDGIEQ